MLHLLLSVISVLATPHPDIHLLLVLQQELVVDVVEVGPREHLCRVVLKHRLHRDDLRPGLSIPRCLRLGLIVDSILVETLHILVDVSEDPVQVED